MHNWVIMNRQLLSSSFFTLLKPSLDPRHTSFKPLFKPLTESTSRFLLYFSCTFTLLKNKNSVSFNYQRQCAFKSLQNALPQNCTIYFCSAFYIVVISTRDWMKAAQPIRLICVMPIPVHLAGSPIPGTFILRIAWSTTLKQVVEFNFFSSLNQWDF